MCIRDRIQHAELWRQADLSAWTHSKNILITKQPLSLSIIVDSHYQLNHLQHIQNSLACAVLRAPKSSHINPTLKSLHWLKSKQRIDYKILSLTYKVLTTTQPSYLYNLISVQPHYNTRSSDVVTLSRPPSSSSLKVNNRSFRHASPCLWNQLLRELRLPTDHEDLSLLSLSSDLTHVSSSYPSSPLSPTIASSIIHSRLNTHLFHKTFPP